MKRDPHQERPGLTRRCNKDTLEYRFSSDSQCCQFRAQNLHWNSKTAADVSSWALTGQVGVLRSTRSTTPLGAPGTAAVMLDSVVTDHNYRDRKSVV